MKPRFQADADLHPDIVAGLIRREPSIDFRFARTVIPDGMQDRDVLLLASTEERIVVSHDVSTMPASFYKLRGEGRTLPGLFLVSQSLAIKKAIEELVLIWVASEAAEWRDLVIRLPI